MTEKTHTPYHMKPKGLETTERKCMCCSVAFQSEGIHNRLCVNCRRKSPDYETPSTGYQREAKSRC